MVTIVGLCILGLVALSTGEHVINAGDSDFEDAIGASDSTALVMFYAPWCGHCKKLKPEFELSAKQLSSNDPPVTLVKVDCTEDGKELCSKYEVRGYPTLKIFRGGELSTDYNGPRDARGITKYMQAQVGPASKVLASEVDLKAFLDAKQEVVVVCYSKDDLVQKAFDKVASKLRERVTFGTLNKNTKEYSGVVLHRPKHLASKMEPSSVVFDGELSLLSDWVEANYHGFVGHRTMDNMADFKRPLLVAYYGVDYTKDVKGTNYWRNRIMKVSKNHDKLNFAVSNKDDFLSELAGFGLDTPSTPDQKAPIVTILDSEGKKYIMSSEFSVDNLEAFVKDFGADKLEPFLKSEPIPDNTNNAVRVVVGKTIGDLMENEGKEKDILIEFYAPWCGHCKSLAPVYEELGEKMAGENVVIAKMDATANDVPPMFQVKGFPTIYWVSAGGTPKSYESGREVKDFIKYVSKEATKELNGYDRKGKVKKSEL